MESISMSDKNVFFYYLKKEREDGFEHPYGTVCIKKNDDGTVNRGIAICSTSDNFNKKIGREISFARMNKAICKKITCDNFMDYYYFGNSYTSKFPIVSYLGDNFKYKCYYHVEPTKKEYRIMNKPE